MEFLAPWHIVIVVVVLLLVFGPKKLPELGNSLGKSITGFRKGLKEVQEEVSTSVAGMEKPETVVPVEPAIAQNKVVEGDEGKSQA